MVYCVLSSSLIPATFSAHYSSLLPEYHKCIKLSYCLKAFCRVQIFSHTALNSESGAELPCTEAKETNNGFSTLANNKVLLNLHPLKVCKWWPVRWSVVQTIVRILKQTSLLLSDPGLWFGLYQFFWFLRDIRKKEDIQHSLFNLLHLLLFITLCTESGQFVQIHLDRP